MPKNKKIKVCFFNSCKVWGGGEKWHFETASSINKEIFNPIIITNKNSALCKKSTESNLNIKTFKVSNLSFINPIKLLNTYFLFRRENIDIIILNLPSDLKLAGCAAKLAGIKRIIYRRGSAIPVRNTFLNRFLFKYIISDIIANSKETKKTLLQNKNLIADEKIEVIYNGLDLNKYTNAIFRKTNSSVNSKIIIGNAGRLDYQKAQHHLINLSLLLKKKNINHEILIAGEGSKREELQNLITKNNLGDNIKLLGFISDITTFYNKIDIFILTSRWEGFGYVIAEAMACFKPVLGYDNSSNPELIEHGKTGFLVPPFETKEFVPHIQSLLNDTSLYEKLALNSRKKIESEFTFQIAISKTETFLLKTEKSLT